MSKKRKWNETYQQYGQLLPKTGEVVAPPSHDPYRGKHQYRRKDVEQNRFYHLALSSLR